MIRLLPAGLALLILAAALALNAAPRNCAPILIGHSLYLGGCGPAP